MFVACGIWCLADVSSVSPSSEQTYPTGDKHTISTLLIKPIFSVLAHAEKQFFSKLVFECSITNIVSPGSQPAPVLLRTTPTQTINQSQALSHLGHNQRQCFSGLFQPRRSTNHKHCLTWVTTRASPSQDYSNPDDQPTTNNSLLLSTLLVKTDFSSCRGAGSIKLTCS